MKRCPPSYKRAVRNFLCVESLDGNMHVVPRWQSHQLRATCPCGPRHEQWVNVTGRPVLYVHNEEPS